TVEVLLGSQARLPCDLGPRTSGVESEPSLIRWFRADASSSAGLQRQPLYTVERDAKK
ncbi:hypothetical protein HPB47_007144, partial [Ixodes persulcatus]